MKIDCLVEGKIVEIDKEQFDEPLLNIIEDAGQEWPFGCRVGTCGSCMAFVLEGVELLSAPVEVESESLKRYEGEVGPEGSTARLLCRSEFCQSKITDWAKAILKVSRPL